MITINNKTRKFFYLVIISLVIFFVGYSVAFAQRSADKCVSSYSYTFGLEWTSCNGQGGGGGTFYNDNARLTFIDSLPSVLVEGQTYTFKIKVENIGNTIWYHGDIYHLMQLSSLSIIPDYGHLPEVIYPGGSFESSFTIVAPSVGNYSLSMQMKNLDHQLFFGNIVTNDFSVQSASCSIDSFTADNYSLAYNTGTTLRFSLTTGRPWTIALLSGSTATSPSSGVGSDAVSTGNLTSTHVYRLTCDTSTRDLVVTVPPQAFSIWGSCFGWPSSSVEINTDQTAGDLYTLQRRQGSNPWADLITDKSFFDFDHYTDSAVVSGQSYDYRVIKRNASGSTISNNIVNQAITEANCNNGAPTSGGTCDDPTATNFGGSLPCVYPSGSSCGENANVTIRQALPATMILGQTYPFVIRATNTGATIWYHGTYYRLVKRSGNLNIVSVSPFVGQDYGHIPMAVQPLSVGYDNYVDWTFNVTPTAVGSASVSMQMVHKPVSDYLKPDLTTCPSPLVDTYFGNSAGVSSSVVSGGNVPPNPPTITGPTRGRSNTNYTYTLLSTDPNGDTIRYGVDWKLANGTYGKDGIADIWLPSDLGYINSGVAQNVILNWNIVGVKSFQVLAQDSKGDNSAWTNYSVNISDVPPSGTAYISNVSKPACSNTDYSVSLTYSANGGAAITWGYITDHSSMSYSLHYASKPTPPNPMVFPAANFMFYDGAAGAFTLQPNVSYWASVTSPTSVPSEDLPVTWNVPTCPTNTAPNPPIISGPTIGNPGINYIYTFQGTDPDGDTIRYGVDWKKASGATYNLGDILDGVADIWIPDGGYVVSGTSRNTTLNWGENGSKVFNVLTQDFKGANSLWSNYTVTISDPPPAVNGSCGTRATTYPLGTTEYPLSDTFCTSPLPSIPVNPSFPSVSSPVTWICPGTISVQCTADVLGQQHKLTVGYSTGGRVVSSDGRINCGNGMSNCEYDYNENTAVNLQTIPNSSYWKFSNWVGDCSSYSNNTCSLIIDGNKVTSAIFVPREFNYIEF